MKCAPGYSLSHLAITWILQCIHGFNLSPLAITWWTLQCISGYSLSHLAITWILQWIHGYSLLSLDTEMHPWTSCQNRLLWPILLQIGRYAEANWIQYFKLCYRQWAAAMVCAFCALCILACFDVQASLPLLCALPQFVEAIELSVPHWVCIMHFYKRPALQADMHCGLKCNRNCNALWVAMHCRLLLSSWAQRLPKLHSHSPTVISMSYLHHTGSALLLRKTTNHNVSDWKSIFRKVLNDVTTLWQPGNIFDVRPFPVRVMVKSLYGQ